MDTQGRSSNASIYESNNGTVDITGIFDFISNELNLFGGQSHCKNCRCFRSSLVEIGSIKYNPLLPSMGACYVSNCASPTLLQFGIRGLLCSRSDGRLGTVRNEWTGAMGDLEQSGMGGQVMDDLEQSGMSGQE